MAEDLVDMENVDLQFFKQEIEEKSQEINKILAELVQLQDSSETVVRLDSMFQTLIRNVLYAIQYSIQIHDEVVQDRFIAQTKEEESIRITIQNKLFEVILLFCVIYSLLLQEEIQ